MATIKTYSATEFPATDEIPDGQERIALVTDDETGLGYYQVEKADGSFYLCDLDGEVVHLSNWTLQRYLADVDADDSDAFFEAIEVTATRVVEG